MSRKDNKISKDMDWRVQVFDSLSFPTLILRPDMVVVQANQIFIEKFGHIKEILGKRCHEIFYASQKPCPPDTCPFMAVIMNKKGESTLKQVIDENGKERWEDRVFSPILDDNGKVLYIMESVRDVTRLKGLEKELRETKEFFESVMQFLYEEFFFIGDSLFIMFVIFSHC